MKSVSASIQRRVTKEISVIQVGKAFAVDYFHCESSLQKIHTPISGFQGEDGTIGAVGIPGYPGLDGEKGVVGVDGPPVSSLAVMKLFSI